MTINILFIILFTFIFIKELYYSKFHSSIKFEIILLEFDEILIKSMIGLKYMYIFLFPKYKIWGLLQLSILDDFNIIKTNHISVNAK